MHMLGCAGKVWVTCELVLRMLLPVQSVEKHARRTRAAVCFVATLRSCRLASLNPCAVLRACRLLSTLTYSLPAIGHARGKALDMVYRAVLEARRMFVSSACCAPGSGEQEAGILT